MYRALAAAKSSPLVSSFDRKSLSLQSALYRRCIYTTKVNLHDNPLGLPRKSDAPSFSIPRKSGPPQKRRIPHVKNVVVVASGKGGVGKSTVAGTIVNLAVALALRKGANDSMHRPRVGLLDLDIFGPSIPKLMGLDNADEPLLTSSGAIVPVKNHGLPCMSMGFLLPKQGSREDSAVVWRGLMVQKAVQQLLFDVDWRDGIENEAEGPGLDVLVIDMPPGTGDVPLTLGQLVLVDGAVIVSTPQDVALSDVRKGISMFRKLSIPVEGLVLNTSYFLCPSCSTPHRLYGSSDSVHRMAKELGTSVLGELPLIPEVSEGGDRGTPFMLGVTGDRALNAPSLAWRSVMESTAEHLWKALNSKST
ncbi:P-loop containing nucleoside triphosphate hydrolase protein [Schizopora paradoxa]|uniref:p-loop containing nucleoside triphosphate hydrolase protein n=1 Tax=Schizopora paradoxa TaxID=27342 RepID=A0A0H2RW84_9AGAM|nr:P-loop containing nucleoside triphosphate hydrolase protein [Schizopora paradoxa]